MRLARKDGQNMPLSPAAKKLGDQMLRYRDKIALASPSVLPVQVIMHTGGTTNAKSSSKEGLGSLLKEWCQMLW